MHRDLQEARKHCEVVNPLIIEISILPANESSGSL